MRLGWVLADPARTAYAGSAGTVGAAWPQLPPGCRIERPRTLLRRGPVVKVTREGTSAVTSRGPERARAAAGAAGLRGHWGIETRTPGVREVPFDEDRAPLRSGAAPPALAAGRNRAVALLRRDGQANIAAALRTDGGRPRAAPSA